MAENENEQRERQLQCAAEEKASFLEEKIEQCVQNLTWNCLADVENNEDSENVKSLQVAILDYQKKIKKWVMINNFIDY